MMKPQVLIVDDDPSQIRVLAQVLRDLVDVQFALTGEDALTMLGRRPTAYDLLLLDAHLPDIDGLEVCARLKSSAETAELPIVFITARNEVAFEVAGFEHGAADFITKPITPAILRARVKTQLQLRRLSLELRRNALEDSLTGLANRRAFDQALRRELLLAQRNGTPVALLLIDVDHFKPYNDALGHLEGDACLKRIAAHLRQACHRPTDLLARVGGEEFAALLPGTPSAGGHHVAAQMAEAMSRAAIGHPWPESGGRVTVSVGLSVLSPQSLRQHPSWVAMTEEGRLGLEPEADWLQTTLLASADRALYAAKEAGRNRCVEGPCEPPR